MPQWFEQMLGSDLCSIFCHIKTVTDKTGQWPLLSDTKRRHALQISCAQHCAQSWKKERTSEDTPGRTRRIQIPETLETVQKTPKHVNLTLPDHKTSKTNTQQTINSRIVGQQSCVCLSDFLPPTSIRFSGVPGAYPRVSIKDSEADCSNQPHSNDFNPGITRRGKGTSPSSYSLVIDNSANFDTVNVCSWPVLRKYNTFDCHCGSNVS